MTIKDVLVHVDASGADASAIRFAAAVAARHRARLTGLFLRTELPAGQLFVGAPADTHAELAGQAGREVEAAAAGRASRFAAIPYRAPSEALNLALEEASLADLLVVGRHTVDGHTTPADMAEHLILKSGRPLVTVPQREGADFAVETAVVGWRPGRETARALHDSMPILAMANRVVVVRLGHATGGDILGHLRAHGVEAALEAAVAEGAEIPDALLSRAHEHKADLLVVGAVAGYGMSMLGAGTLTRHMLARARIPVLFGY